MRFITLSLAVLLTVATAAAPASAKAFSPVGQWEVSSGESRYSVRYCGDGTELCAMLVWLRDDARTADNLALLDTYVVRGARPDETNSWSGEIIMAGKIYNGTMTLTSNDSMHLESCMGMLCRSFEFRRR